jgi:hypothetical protein
VNKPNPKILRALHLASELSTATELLSLGLNQVASPKWQARQPGGAFTQLSQGVERLLKATFWVSETSHGRSVDSKFGTGASGHAIAELDQRVFGIYVSESQSATPYMKELIAEARSDPYWKDILLALDRWAATSGRYRDLDALRGRTHQGDPPWASWDAAEHRAITEAGGWGNLTAKHLIDSRRRLLLSFMRWWHVHYRAWQHGLVGAEGKQFSSEIRPTSLHLDPSVAALVDGR